MICRYEFKNYKSFQEFSILDLLAPNNKVKNRFTNNYNKTDFGLDVLKTAVIVGENAGGKTNLINSLHFFQSLFKTNEKIGSFKNLINTNNACSQNPEKCDTEQSFSFDILIKGNLYKYILVIDYLGIVFESLSFKQTIKGKELTIFSLERDSLSEDKRMSKYIFISKISPELKKALNNTMKSSETIGLFINKLAILGNEHCLNFVNYINNNLYADKIFLNYNYNKDLKKEESDFKILKDKRFLEILKMVDSSIVSIEINEEHPYLKTRINRKKMDGSIFSKELVEDSSGAMEFFAWAVQIYRVVYENKVVFADEMDRVLNPVLSDKIISFINGTNHKGQFIFTTHNVLHLDLKKYMKEQIYFVSKNPQTLNSELYSLADFPEVRYETTKIHEFYMKGILGGTLSE